MSNATAAWIIRSRLHSGYSFTGKKERYRQFSDGRPSTHAWAIPMPRNPNRKWTIFSWIAAPGIKKEVETLGVQHIGAVVTYQDGY